MIQFNTKQYLLEISQNYIFTCFSSQFVLDFCTRNDIKPIIQNVWIFFNQTGTKLILCYVNWDDNKLISQIMTIHIGNFNIKMFSKLKFKQYLSKNCCFHIVSYWYWIVSYHFFVLILQSCPSLLGLNEDPYRWLLG